MINYKKKNICKCFAEGEVCDGFLHHTNFFLLIANFDAKVKGINQIAIKIKYKFIIPTTRSPAYPDGGGP